MSDTNVFILLSYLFTPHFFAAYQRLSSCVFFCFVSCGCALRLLVPRWLRSCVRSPPVCSPVVAVASAASRFPRCVGASLVALAWLPRSSFLGWVALRALPFPASAGFFPRVVSRGITLTTLSRVFRPAGRRGDTPNRNFVVVSNPVTSDRGVSASDVQTNSK